MSDAPAIRPHSPRQNRWAMTALALLAVGSFANAAIQKAGAFFPSPPLSDRPLADRNAAPPAPSAAPTPAIEVATAQPVYVRPSPAETPRLNVPAPAQVAANPASPATSLSTATEASAAVPSPGAPAAPPADAADAAPF